MLQSVSVTLHKKIFYNILANATFVVHLLLVLLVSIGWIVPALFYFFLLAVFLTILSEIFLGYCVLSKIEFDARRKINPAQEYDTSCIMHYGRGLFGLKPRVKNNTPKSFFQKNSFLFLLGVLLLVASTYNYYF